MSEDRAEEPSKEGDSGGGGGPVSVTIAFIAESAGVSVPTGAVPRKAEKGAMAEPWQPTTTRRGAVPDPASPA